MVHTIVSFLTGAISFAYLHIHPLRGDTAVLLLAALIIGPSLVIYATQVTEKHATLVFWIEMVSLYITGIIISTVIFRISFLHPLNKFPGPFINKFTNIASAYTIFTGSHHLTVKNYHERYGKFVRIGPNTLSINSHTAIIPVYSAASAMKKSTAYTFGGINGKGLFFMQNKHEHSLRRRLWAKGFSIQSLEVYRPAIERHTLQLIDCMPNYSTADGVIDMSKCIDYWAYDVMGDIVFGNANPFNLLKDGDTQNLIRSGRLATMIFEVVGEMPSLFHILWHLPATKYMHCLKNHAEQLIISYQKQDIILSGGLASALLNEHNGISKLSAEDLCADILFAIQAGSDTPSGVATLLVFFLLSHEAVYLKLQEELDRAFSKDTLLPSIKILQGLPYINAVLHEALRLGTPFGGFPRIVPKTGVIIDGEFIPGGTIVSVPTYTQEVSEENFTPDPLSFKPERWLSSSMELNTQTNKAALMAFSSGPYGCLGQELAWQELLIFTAQLMLKYDLKFAPSFDQTKFLSGISNLRVTLFSSPLQVVAIKR